MMPPWGPRAPVQPSGCQQGESGTLRKDSALPGLGIIVPLKLFLWALLFMFTSWVTGDFHQPFWSPG